ncbi:MAG: propionyl-CoA synthetase [Candidatus Phaeomarinobacter sp.]
MSTYHGTYTAWHKDPETFWTAAADGIDWDKRWDQVLDVSERDNGTWFKGAMCNTAYNCLDRHVAAGNGDRAALIYDSPVTKFKKTYTYSELLNEVAALAAVLVDRGLTAGDRAIIYMPMIPEAAIAMLACARIGVVHSVVFGGFAAHELATRIDDAKPKAMLLAACGIEPGRVVAYKPLVDAAIDQSRHKPAACLVLQRPMERADITAGRDHDWGECVADAKAQNKRADCVSVAATDPLYILYTSGTTGQPKGVVRDNGGHMVALNWSMKAIYGMDPGDVFWAASDVGWVVGHSYIVYGPLLAGCTSVLYEGKPVGTPDAGAFWRVISEHNVKALFTAPTAFRAIKQQDPEGALIADYDLSNFDMLFLAGERADPPTVQWAEEKLKVPVIDHWWQTETGWAIASNPAGLGLLAVKHGSPTVAMPGYDVRVLDDAGHEVPAGTTGSIAVKLPLPPGCLPTLWENDERFKEAYLSEFPGYYKTADAGFTDDDGYLLIMARTDDIINVAGHRLSTGGMEEVLAGHPDVAECAVIGVADELKGQLPLGFVVLKAGCARSADDIEQDCVGLVRQEIGPVAAFKRVIVIKRLPKPRSGKILRGTMSKISDDVAWKMPATIDDPAILDEITAAVTERGYAKTTTADRA